VEGARRPSRPVAPTAQAEHNADVRARGVSAK
jgi:hypothetical protein